MLIVYCLLLQRGGGRERGAVKCKVIRQIHSGEKGALWQRLSLSPIHLSMRYSGYSWAFGGATPFPRREIRMGISDGFGKKLTGKSVKFFDKSDGEIRRSHAFTGGLT